MSPLPRVIVNDPINFYAGREAEIVDREGGVLWVRLVEGVNAHFALRPEAAIPLEIVVDEAAERDAYERQFG